MAEEEKKSWVRDYLKFITDKFPNAPVNPYQFQLTHGKQFYHDASSFAGPRGKQHMCYMNAGKEALANHNFTYAEGFVTVHGVPIEHAWLVDSNGKVYDPTLIDNNQVGEYWGVPVKQEYLKHRALKTGKWGVFGFLEQSYLKDDPAQIIQHVIVQKPENPVEPINYLTLTDRSIGQRKRHGDPKAKYEAQRRKLMKKMLKEEGDGGVVSGSVAITNSVAAGGVAGITGEPPVGNKNKAPLMKRKANILKKTIKEGKELALWKYNKRTGYWGHQRNVTVETKDQWHSTFQKDEPDEHFHLSVHKPKHNPTKK